MTALVHKIKVAQNEKQKNIPKIYESFTEKCHQALISNYRRVRIP